jgi:hypothetical protein
MKAPWPVSVLARYGEGGVGPKVVLNDSFSRMITKTWWIVGGAADADGASAPSAPINAANASAQVAANLVRPVPRIALRPIPR